MQIVPCESEQPVFCTYMYNVHVYQCFRQPNSWRSSFSTETEHVSQRGDSPFVYRDGAGWPAPLPYIWKIRVSVVIGTHSSSGIRLHERVPMVKIWGTTKIGLNQTTGKSLKL